MATKESAYLDVALDDDPEARGKLSQGGAVRPRVERRLVLEVQRRPDRDRQRNVVDDVDLLIREAEESLLLDEVEREMAVDAQLVRVVVGDRDAVARQRQPQPVGGAPRPVDVGRDGSGAAVQLDLPQRRALSDRDQAEPEPRGVTRVEDGHGCARARDFDRCGEARDGGSENHDVFRAS